VPPQGGRKHPDQVNLQVDTRNILFICGGAFAGLEKTVRFRTEKRAGIGFSAEVKGETEKQSNIDILQQVEPEDLIKYGLIPEFIGRLPVVAMLDELDETQLIQILTEPKNAITKQYAKLFEMENAKLEIRTEALHAVAHKAIERKAGARGLRSILEHALLETMYDLPSLNGVEKVIIDDAVIRGEAKPYFVYNRADLPLVAS